MAELPLAGRRIAVTRPREQAVPLAAELERLGAEVASVPLVEIAPIEDADALDAAGAALSRYDWVVFTSANGVRAFGERLTHDETPRVAAVGSATADAVRDLGVEPAFVGRSDAVELAADLDVTDGARVLVLQADIAGRELSEALRARGALVDAITAYHTVARVPTDVELEALAGAEAIVLASGSAARALAALSPAVEGSVIACIGPKTASAASEVGLRVDLVAEETTIDGIIRALVEHSGESM